MNNLLFNQNYQNDITNFEILNKKNFLIFKIKNFLDFDTYEFLNKSFPKIDDQRISNFDLKKNNYKYTIISTDPDYKQLIEKNENLKKIHNAIFSEKFCNYFFKNLKIEFLKSRSKDIASLAFESPKLDEVKESLEYLIKLFKPKTLDFNKNYFKNIFYTYVKRQIEYSFIFNKGKIVPHTDGRAKLLSLMMYFPEGREGESEIGTTFWDSNQKNFANEHLRDFKEKKFKENNKILTKLEFNKYDLYGFIRNTKSWHSVEPFDLGKNYVRRSININFYL